MIVNNKFAILSYVIEIPKNINDLNGEREIYLDELNYTYIDNSFIGGLPSQL